MEKSKAIEKTINEMGNVDPKKKRELRAFGKKLLKNYCIPNWVLTEDKREENKNGSKSRA
jgi:hypothetical protein